MPEIIQCPECERKLRVPDDMVGKRVKCPGCGTPFTAGGDGQADSEPEAPKARKSAREEEQIADERVAARRRAVPRNDEDNERRRDEDDEDREGREEEEEGRGRRRRRRRPRVRRTEGSYDEWGKTRSGVTLVLISVFVKIAGIVVTLIGVLILILGVGATVASGAQNPGQPPTSDAALAGLGGFALLACFGCLLRLAAIGLDITGNVFCIFSPQQNAMKILAIVSLVLLVLALLIDCGGGALGGAMPGGGGYSSSRAGSYNGGGGGGGLGPVASVAGFFISFAQIIVFLFFLRAVALSLGQDGLAKSILMLAILAIVTVVISCGGGVVVFFAAGAMIFSSLGAAGAGKAGAGTAGAGMAGAGVLVIAFFALVILLGLVVYVWYIVSLFQVRGAISRHLGDK